jgi:hypothetical protein
VRKINQQIRQEMDQATTREQLTELKKRSDYRCTLVESPSWEKKFGVHIDEMLRVALEENHKTTEQANALARRYGWEANYNPWGNG